MNVHHFGFKLKWVVGGTNAANRNPEAKWRRQWIDQLSKHFGFIMTQSGEVRDKASKP